MMFLLRMLMRRKGGQSMDPLQVSMTGVRMGEKFLLVGCRDRALLAGLAAKVGLSGTAAVAAFDPLQIKLVEKIGAQVGALIESKLIEGRALPFDSDQFDMVVIDDTDAGFSAIDAAAQMDYLREARRTVRQGGRIEVVTRIDAARDGVNFEARLTEAGFKPVRILAERNGLRFIEGLRMVAPS